MKTQCNVTKVVIPTYPEPDKERLPMYCENRNHQRTSGRVYPNAIINHVVRDKKENKEYTAIVLENDFIELIILPEIGGRIFGARDKTNSYNFFYRQHVIKPALIGMLGSWISGGAEFNWPMHHRLSTFMPVDYDIEESQDGRVTVWLSEHEPMDRMKGMVGICVYPNKAMFETRVRLFNRTAIPHSFLWWENIAVHVNKEYQIFFPQDVNYVYYHYKKSVTEYPIANSMYNGIDYRPKKPDIRWHKNTVCPTSYFSARSNYNFFGGYDHSRKAGVVHIANHHISPGKKLFTWGYNQLSKSWENTLTDTDGPYAELMTGVYSDNQPDFSWLEPYETKEFSQYWYPIKEIGEPKNANTRIALNYRLEPGKIKVLLYAVEELEHVTLELSCDGDKFHSSSQTLPICQTSIIELNQPKELDESKLSIMVLDKKNKEIISFRKHGPIEKMVPKPTEVVPSSCELDNKKRIHREGFYLVAPSPCEIDNPEELFFAGLHMKQYRDPLVKPDVYWLKAVEKDPAHYKSNNALGLSALKEGRFTDAENYFQKAIAALTMFNPNPRDGEAFYGLGLALNGQGKNTAAYDAFYKSIWNCQWRSSGYYSLAQIDCINENFKSAMKHLSQSLITNADNLKARNLLAAVERILGNPDLAVEIARKTLKMDPLCYWAMNELSLLENSSKVQKEHFFSLMNSDPSQTLLDVVFDYFQAGLFSDATNLISRFIRYMKDKDVSPIIYYAYGYLLEKLGQNSESEKAYRTAKKKNPDYCFPSRLEEMIILQEIVLKRKDCRAAYYLGNLLYDKEQYEEALLQWEQALQSGEDYYVLYRNLGMAYYNNRRDYQKSIEFVRKALELEPQNPQLIFELNHLMQLVNSPLDERFKLLESNISIVQSRDALYLELVRANNQAGECSKAIELLKKHSFTPCEGGEHAVVEQYIFANFKLGRFAYRNGDFKTALSYFQQGQSFPDNLNAGIWDIGIKIPCLYYEALCLDQLGEKEKAGEIYEYMSNMGIDFFTKMYQPAIYYYQAMVFKKLGETEKAESQLTDCIKMWKEETAKKDYGYFKITPFFISYLEDPKAMRLQHFSYLLGLAYEGLENRKESSACFAQVVNLNSSHLWAALELELMEISSEVTEQVQK